MSAPAGQRALSGDAGYKRLVRLLARAFYAGECPPKEAEPEDMPAGARGGMRRDKNDYIGLGVLLLDMLVGAHGFVKDAAITSQLGVSGKVANRALRFLQAEGLLASEVTKTKVRRQNVEQPDDADMEAKMSQMTNTWWCVSYPQMLDSLHLRLHRMRERLRRHLGDGEDVLEYLCRRCGATYTSLDAIRLLDPASGAFHCEECRAELEPSVDAVGLGAGAGGGAASRQQMQHYAKRMLEMMEQQLRPLTEQLEKLKEVPPPDFGSLRDWHQRQHDLQRRRQEQAAAARAKMAGRGLDQEHLDDDQVLDWLAQAEVQVDLGDGAAAAAAAAGPGKELPLWFRGTESESVGPGGSQDLPGGEAEQQRGGAGNAEEQRRVQEAFLAQYLAQVQAAAAAGQAGEDLEGTELGAPDKKRIKTENGYAGIKQEQPTAAAAAAAGDGGMLWEDAKPELKQEQPPAAGAAGGGLLKGDVKDEHLQQEQQQQPPQQEQPPDGGDGEADEDGWEDI